MEDTEILKIKEELKDFALAKADSARNQAIGVLAFASLILGLASYLFVETSITAKMNEIGGQKLLEEARNHVAAAKTARENIEAIKNEISEFSQDRPNLLENSKEIIAHQGLWGEWKKPVMAPPNHYVAGISVKFEGNRGKGDDTALNAVKLYCVPFSQAPKEPTVGDAQ